MAFTSSLGTRVILLLAAIVVVLSFKVVGGVLDSSGQQIQAGEWMKFRTHLTKACNMHQIDPLGQYTIDRPISIYPGFFIRYYDETVLKTMTPSVKAKCGTDKCVCLARNFVEPVDCISLPKIGCNTELRFSYPLEQERELDIFGGLLTTGTEEFSILGYRVFSTQSEKFRINAAEFPVYDDNTYEASAKGKRMSWGNLLKGAVSTIAKSNRYYDTPHTVYIQFFFLRTDEGERLLAYVPEGGAGAVASTDELTASWNNWDLGATIQQAGQLA